MNTTKCCMWKTLVKGPNKECGWIRARWQKGPVQVKVWWKRDLLMCPHNVSPDWLWKTASLIFHCRSLHDFRCNHETLPSFMKLKSTYPKETKKTKKKGNNNKKREPTSNQETTLKETTPKIANPQTGPQKRERERESNGMEWNELLWRFFIHSFLSFLV